jgi:5-methylcytosine-specific restriction protein A
MMSIGLDLKVLRRRLESRFGLGITFELETIEGGEFPVFRVAGVERGTGFGIVLARTFRQIEASFFADNFAATLLRRMSESDLSARATFSALLTAAAASNTHVFVAVNGNSARELPDISDPWRKVELDVSLRLMRGKQQDEDVLNRALAVCSCCLAMVLALVMADDLLEVPSLQEKGLPEGAKMRVEVNRYERSPANRAACIAHYGTACQGCGFDFLSTYGELGEGYIEVHHRTPVSQMGDGYYVDPVSDLIPLCANCHAMVHRADPVMPLEVLRDLVQALPAR